MMHSPFSATAARTSAPSALSDVERVRRTEITVTEIFTDAGPAFRVVTELTTEIARIEDERCEDGDCEVCH
jgi:hypothetical protein